MRILFDKAAYVSKPSNPRRISERLKDERMGRYSEFIGRIRDNSGKHIQDSGQERAVVRRTSIPSKQRIQVL